MQILAGNPRSTPSASLAGDFETPAMKRMVEQYLGPWQVAEDQPTMAPPIPNPPLPPQTITAQQVTATVSYYKMATAMVQNATSSTRHAQASLRCRTPLNMYQTFGHQRVHHTSACIPALS